jgi:hypothetical protein
LTYGQGESVVAERIEEWENTWSESNLRICQLQVESVCVLRGGIDVKGKLEKMQRCAKSLMKIIND